MIDLKRHAQRYRMNGLPIYGRWEDGEEDMQVGVIVEPLWQWADLGEADRATVPMFDPRFKAPNRIMKRRHVIDFGEKTVSAPTADMVRPNGRPLFPGRSQAEPVRLVPTTPFMVDQSTILTA